MLQTWRAAKRYYGSQVQMFQAHNWPERGAKMMYVRTDANALREYLRGRGLSSESIGRNLTSNPGPSLTLCLKRKAYSRL